MPLGLFRPEAFFIPSLEESMTTAQGERFLKREEVDIHSSFLRHAMTIFPDIKTFEDSEKALGIPVFQQDIDDAEPGNPAKCAVSIGAMRNVPGCTGALTNKSKTVVVFDRIRAVLFKTPYTTYARLIAFDTGGKVEPDVYALSPVPPSSRLVPMQGRIARRKAMLGRAKAKKGEKRPAKAVSKRKKRTSNKMRSLLIRTWGNARLPSTLVTPVQVSA